MRRSLRLAIAIAVSLAAPAAWATPSGLFGNTLQITMPDGSVKKYYVNADGTYSVTLPDGSTVTGTWAETDGQMCFTPQGGSALCGPLITQNVGDNWQAQRPDGLSSQLTIVAGR
jgi:hypothetical protein